MTATDPICGMTVDPATALSADRDGQTYYFCCDHCRQKFLGETGSEVAARPSGDRPRRSAAYFCPMCPDVESERPRDCPTCGMALEPTGIPTSGGQPIWTCPMHPEVEQDAPGACPICGMDLESRRFSETADEHADAELRSMLRRMWVGVALSIPLLTLAMGPMVGLPVHRWIAPRSAQWLQLLLATPVVLWCGWPFFVRGCKSLVTRKLNMFTLIALGTAAAWMYSVAAVLGPRLFPESLTTDGVVDVYFESAAVIVTLVLFGQVLELKARQRTGSAIRELLSLSPPTAHVVRDGAERDVALEHVRIGDQLRVRPGENIPVDGELLAGSSDVNESLMTGESMPVAKAAGDLVIGGSLNGNGSFIMRADRVGSETVLAQIVNLVAEAQRSRAPIQRVADIAASYFVPGVVLASFIAFIAWLIWGPEPRLAYAVVNSVAVLIIACPCALGLATPMSIMVGIGRGAREGVLIRSAAALETLERIDTLAVDKTGTLTAGKPTLTDVIPAGDHSEDELLRLAAAVEQGSEHPLASAVVAAARQRGLTIPEADEFSATTGGGVAARVSGHDVLIGTPAFLAERNVAPCSDLDESAIQLQTDGRTVMRAAVNGTAAGLLAVADPIKESTPDALAALHRAGIRILMLTGDNQATAQSVARKLGIDDVQAGAKPADKQQAVRDLRSRGRVVAMAGDGVNDAPALAEADVGIAMGTGADVAIESADVTLLHGNLQSAVRAVLLSRAVMRNVRQNLFFAFIYNLLGVPIAAGAIYPLFGLLLSPMIAAAAMSLSSVSVISNALRLRTVPLE